MVLYSGKLLRVETIVNFEVLWLLMKVWMRGMIAYCSTPVTYPSEEVQYDTIICPAPDLNHTGYVCTYTCI